eukprot:GHVO01042836.1.p1 GENE.GHVO01042836.1~~GHVO01042836.1.p1  ORF type:complete len:259 (+),score=44.65 GHVO01042836.1:114-779(+)
MSTVQLMRHTGAFDHDNKNTYPMEDMKAILDSCASSKLLTHGMAIPSGLQIQEILDTIGDANVDVFSDCPSGYRLESDKVRRFSTDEFYKTRPSSPSTISMIDLSCTDSMMTHIQKISGYVEAPSAFLLTPKGDGYMMDQSTRELKEVKADVEDADDDEVPELRKRAFTTDEPLSTSPFTMAAILTIAFMFVVLAVGFGCVVDIDTPTKFEDKLLMINKEY